jgi:3-oxoadipate enol-lactonase
VDLPLEDYARLMIQLRDIRRHAIWREADPIQFQALFDQTLEGMRVGADEPGREIGARWQLEARSRHDTYDRLPNLRMPVYICGGLYDGIAKPANLKSMQKQIAGSRLELFEGGHLFYIQDPRAFERIVAFLKGDLNG